MVYCNRDGAVADFREQLKDTPLKFFLSLFHKYKIDFKGKA